MMRTSTETCDEEWFSSCGNSQSCSNDEITSLNSLSSNDEESYRTNEESTDEQIHQVDKSPLHLCVPHQPSLTKSYSAPTLSCSNLCSKPCQTNEESSIYHTQTCLKSNASVFSQDISANSECGLPPEVMRISASRMVDIDSNNTATNLLVETSSLPPIFPFLDSDDEENDNTPRQSNIFRKHGSDILNSIRSNLNGNKLPVIEERNSRHVFIKSTPTFIASQNSSASNGTISSNPIPLNLSMLTEVGLESRSVDHSLFSVFTFFQIPTRETVFLLLVYSVFGTTCRVFLGRFFGKDCENPDTVNDFISHIYLCVTASGITNQRGGALFLDLPANILGSFIMGILTPLNKDIPAIPWLKASHWRQTNTGIHLALRTAFCGSLTTFASWNTQMVVMMYGYDTKLGPQIAPALFGYIIGLMCAISSYLFGRHAAHWLTSWINPHILSDGHDFRQDPSSFDVENDDMNINRYLGNNFIESSPRNRVRIEGRELENSPMSNITSSPLKEDIGPMYSGNGCLLPNFVELPKLNGDRKFFFKENIILCFNILLFGRLSPWIFFVVLMSLYIIGDVVFKNNFYREMWMISLFSPLGMFIRWHFSSWNGKFFQRSDRWKWVPIGTMVANILGSFISIVITAIMINRNNEKDNIADVHTGIVTGLCGSLSSVSTFVKEIVHFCETYQGSAKGYYYAFGLILFCSLSSLSLYVIVLKG